MYGALRIDLWFEAAGYEGRLSPLDDVEIVIRRVAARVSFGSNGCSEYEQVLRYACKIWLELFRVKLGNG